MIYEYFHIGLKIAEAKAMKKKEKKGVVQPDVDLEVDSPAHSFLGLVYTPGKLHPDNQKRKTQRAYNTKTHKR